MANTDNNTVSVSKFTRDVVGKNRTTVLNCLYCGKVLLETTLLPRKAALEIKCVTCKNMHFVACNDINSDGTAAKKLDEVRCHTCKKLLFRASGVEGAVIKKDCPRAGCRSTNNDVFV